MHERSTRARAHRQQHRGMREGELELEAGSVQHGWGQGGRECGAGEETGRSRLGQTQRLSLCGALIHVRPRLHVPSMSPFLIFLTLCVNSTTRLH